MDSWAIIYEAKLIIEWQAGRFKWIIEKKGKKQKRRGTWTGKKRT